MKCILYRDVRPAAVCVNEQSIELSRDYNAKAEAITDALIVRIKLKFISRYQFPQ